ncbi:MAG TPA: 6-phosphogluconolactonase [Dokdonella sp.]|uniref:6-phosphogluconolactonase n=1 Tax=Dokdonella sp. TaxID=2291710 RepID=UPI0025BEED1F|nr:6-phosphogluconolactonase [Dokdonella sp.]MBX3691789.1 6-phosphogluconolactonase [Dokdonella sp.]MCW5568909.1 6-phosphogluconolactonase [Dokdonella sp.]HNR90790.1 6-phosphogluconolactonase [Dokdonella sp.]
MNAQDDPRILFEEYAGEVAWVAHSVAVIAAALVERLEREARARLLLSGGSTPLPVYKALGAAPLDWSRIDIGLVDERDVGADDDGSNARLVRTTLVAALAERGLDTNFHPLRERAAVAATAIDRANADPRVDPAGAVLVLGMGDDGHTASLFPGSRDLAAAFATRQPYALLDASGCGAAGRWPQRLTLTRAGLVAAAARILLLRGTAKRTVLERALDAGSHEALPICCAIDAPNAPLRVIACRE